MLHRNKLSCPVSNYALEWINHFLGLKLCQNVLPLFAQPQTSWIISHERSHSQITFTWVCNFSPVQRWDAKTPHQRRLAELLAAELESDFSCWGLGDFIRCVCVCVGRVRNVQGERSVVCRVVLKTPPQGSRRRGRTFTFSLLSANSMQVPHFSTDAVQSAVFIVTAGKWHAPFWRWRLDPDFPLVSEEGRRFPLLVLKTWSLELFNMTHESALQLSSGAAHQTSARY